MLYLVQSKICKAAGRASPHTGRPGRNPASILKNERGDVNYFSTVVFIFVAVLLLAFILDLFSIISTKQELDHCADQMVKQIQLSGSINGETDQLFNFLCSQIEGAENISYSVDASHKSPTPSGMNRAIQLGTPFYITITGRAKLGGFWNFNLVNITVVSRGAGVSEYCGHYTAMLEDMVTDGLASKIPLFTDDYQVRDIRLAFHVTGDRVEYVFTCNVEFYVRTFGRSYPAITRRVELTGYHNTKF